MQAGEYSDTIDLGVLSFSSPNSICDSDIDRLRNLICDYKGYYDSYLFKGDFHTFPTTEDVLQLASTDNFYYIEFYWCREEVGSFSEQIRMEPIDVY